MSGTDINYNAVEAREGIRLAKINHTIQHAGIIVRNIGFPSARARKRCDD